MFYTLFIFTLGIYIGQEYSTVPSVKLYLHNALEYIKKYEVDSQQSTQPETIINFEKLTQFFKKN